MLNVTINFQDLQKKMNILTQDAYGHQSDKSRKETPKVHYR